MRHRFLLLLLAVLTVTACSTVRRVPANPEVSPWVGCTTMDILKAMGDPDRIDSDGKGGSLLVYESGAYDDPNYDILDPEASVKGRLFAYFYLDEEGICYRVNTNRDLPAAPRTSSSVFIHHPVAVLFDLLLLFPLWIAVEVLF